MKRPVLIVLTGLPAAGKSTLAKRLALALAARDEGQALVIASDTVRGEMPVLETAFLPEVEPAVRAMTRERVESALRHGFWAIHDDLNYYRSMRFEMVETARGLQVPHALVHLATPAERCLEYNATRGRTVPDEVIRKDAARFDPPGQDPWDTPLAAYPSPEISDEVMEGLLDALIALREAYLPWEPPVEVEHVPTAAERMDACARSVVSELFRSGVGKADGEAVAKRRRELVKEALAEGVNRDGAEAWFRERLAPLFAG